MFILSISFPKIINLNINPSKAKEMSERLFFKYVYKNKLYDSKMTHESKCQEIKDRKHDAFMHKYHLIDLLRTSKYPVKS